MRILLIGATGQIGYSLAKALAQTTHHITVLVRDRTKRPFPETVRVFESRLLNPQAFRQALKRILTRYFDYYHRRRTHLSLEMDSPESRSVQLPALGKVVQFPEVGGIHHHYERLAA